MKEVSDSRKSVILIPYADLEQKQSGVNIGKNLDRRKIYLQNVCVALISAKVYNPNTDVALVTNIELPVEYQKLLQSKDVLIFKEEYDRFVFPNDYTWSLAFYKLCALSKVLEKGQYDCYAYLDSDVYVQESFDTIWQECEKNILLYDINHGLGTKDYIEIEKEFQRFSPARGRLITHFGGEFFASNKANAVAFLNECIEIYQEMQSRNFCTTKGDEFIVSLAADKLKVQVKNAGAYIYRFWTRAFYLVSTCYQYNPITVLHVPDEKSRGMLKIYAKYIKRGKIPNRGTVWKILHLHKQPLSIKILMRIKRLLKK